MGHLIGGGYKDKLRNKERQRESGGLSKSVLFLRISVAGGGGGCSHWTSRVGVTGNLNAGLQFTDLVWSC